MKICLLKDNDNGNWDVHSTIDCAKHLSQDAAHKLVKYIEDQHNATFEADRDDWNGYFTLALRCDLDWDRYVMANDGRYSFVIAMPDDVCREEDVASAIYAVFNASYSIYFGLSKVSSFEELMINAELMLAEDVIQ